jgi:hypothetical protein
VHAVGAINHQWVAHCMCKGGKAIALKLDLESGGIAGMWLGFCGCPPENVSNHDLQY